VLLDAVESFFELGEQWSLTRREAVATHDAPEIIAICPLVSVIYGQKIFGRAACHKDNDVGLGGLVPPSRSPFLRFEDRSRIPPR